MLKRLVSDSDLAKATTAEEAAYKRAAFLAVLGATFATLLAGIALPLSYAQVQYVHSLLQDETSFCMMQSNDLWRRYSGSGTLREKRATHRSYFSDRHKDAKPVSHYPLSPTITGTQPPSLELP